ncbi:hypothetical protein PISMIDRAFT_680055 [Pisolithus microcarpus 441]|uniref:Uncharacterized protein n=1 Tax=Pisolithus microcarpus 441 TaxID=765257 RepID=A0A0C9Z9F5_9AGAM|nr:hypothetical protein PISMIDRAFT_680055 [Pisolithus microcarpus 441]
MPLQLALISSASITLPTYTTDSYHPSSQIDTRHRHSRSLNVVYRGPTACLFSTKPGCAPP